MTLACRTRSPRVEPDTRDRGVAWAKLGLAAIIIEGQPEADKWFTAVNWWATRRWRFSVGGGRATLDKASLVGHTNQVLARVQWIY